MDIKTQIPFKHELCEHCVEYVCHHNYQLLNLQDDVCCVCCEPITKDNAIYLNKCLHKFHDECITNVEIYNEIKTEEKYHEDITAIQQSISQLQVQLSETDEHGQIDVINAINILECELRYIRQKRITTKLNEMFKRKVECPYCRTKNTDRYSYFDVYQLCCNSVLPPLPKFGEYMTLSAYEYNKLYKQYRYRLRPTNEMKEYIDNCQELMGAIWKRNENKINRESIKIWRYGN